MERIAHCACGSLRAIASGDPGIAYVCHCRECQRRTGSVMHAGAFYSRTQVRLEGPAKIFTRRGDSGGEVHCHFCPECGSTVAWFADKLPDRVGIAIGCFADPEFPAPTLSVWEEAMHEWVGLPTGVSRWKQTPTL
ncbi:MAG: GFA family protein [Alphaproteobacteria bacterium]|nr:GFA family protein [Alphaproteobacteria bacterium]